MKRYFLISICLAMALGAAPQEPSAFGAGNLDSPNPYGLSEDQKHILANKKAIEEIRKRLLKQQQTIERNSERLDGIQSLMEGLNDRLRRYDKMDRRIEDLNETVAELSTSQQRNFEQIRTVLQELGAMIDSINEKYVDKSRFEALEKAFLSFKEAYERFLAKSDLGGRANADIYAEAKRMFAKKRYQDAKIRFQHLIKNHYKPATSNYYLGEIAYRDGRYKDAIAYYKKSAALYDKSKFMPTLLLHTAVSFHRLGEKKEAKRFYESVVELYPNSKEAKIAKKNLAKIK